MKRCWMLLSLMMILLLCGHAAAELFAPVPAERLVFMEVPGLVADVVKTPGRVTLNVDVENTDWEKVTTYTYDGVNPGLNIFFGFTPPDGAVYYSSLMGSPGEDWAISNIGNSSAWMVGSEITRWETLANYEFIRGIVRPSENNGDSWLYVRWFDENMQILADEKADIKIKQSTLQPFMADISIPAASDFKAGMEMYGEKVPALSVVSASQGTLSLEVQESGFSGSIYTGVRVPAGTVACEEKWPGGSWFMPVPIENGYAVLTNPGVFDRSKQELSVSCRVLRYLDASGEVIGAHNVCIKMSPGKLKPSPCYVDEWHGYTEDELDIRNPQPGVLDYTYDNDMHLLTVRYVGGEPDPDEELGWFDVWFKAPRGATHVKTISGRQGNMMGYPSWFKDSTYQSLEWTEMEELDGDSVWGTGYWLFDHFTMEEINDSSVEVFMADDAMPDENGGRYCICFWYDSENAQDPIACTYFCTRIEPFVTTVRQPALHSEEEVQNLRYPAMLLDPHHTQNVILVVEIYPQIGNQAIRYDLHVENENGRPMNVPRNAWIYLPYPEGGGPDDNMEYLLQHFNANEQGIGYEKLTKEKQGLRFKPKSLSPFLLSWSRSGDAPAEPEENPTPTVVPTVVPTVAPTPELPRTGDDSHPALLLAAMALALTLMIGLQRKQRRS